MPTAEQQTTDWVISISMKYAFGDTNHQSVTMEVPQYEPEKGSSICQIGPELSLLWHASSSLNICQSTGIVLPPMIQYGLVYFAISCCLPHFALLIARLWEARDK